MRDLHAPDINKYRDCSPAAIRHFGGVGDETCGRFIMQNPIDKAPMCIVAASSMGWDHVSVSRKNRCPNWPEMEFVKRLFFGDCEVCMQLHVAPKDHINDHPTCLHIWRSIVQEIPLPPSFMVGGCSEEEAIERAAEFEKSLEGVCR